MDALIASKEIRSLDEQLLGMEYAGRLSDGRKVTGIVPNGGSSKKAECLKLQRGYDTDCLRRCFIRSQTNQREET